MPDTIKPTFNSAYINAEGTYLYVVFNETSGITYYLSADGFTLGGVPGRSLGNGFSTATNTLRFAIGTNIIYAGETVTVSYTPGDVTDSSPAHNALDAFTSQPVTNNSTVPRAANDDFETATELTGSGNIVGDTTRATAQVGEPNPSFNKRSVWYKYVPGADGILKLNFGGSERDFIRQGTVFTGSSLDSLVARGSFGDGTSGSDAAIDGPRYLKVLAEETYWIRVYGYTGYGEFRLYYTLTDFPKPSGVSVAYDADDDVLQVQWTAPQPPGHVDDSQFANADSVQVERAADIDGPYSLVYTDSTHWPNMPVPLEDTPPDRETEYFYRLRSVSNPSGSVDDYVSGYTTPVSAVFPLPTIGVPVIVLCEAAGTTIRLAWLASSTSTVDRYEIWRGTASGVLSYHATEFNDDEPYPDIDGDQYFVDTGLTPGIEYFYHVVARRGDYSSDPSDEASAVAEEAPVDLPPGTPGGLTYIGMNPAGTAVSLRAPALSSGALSLKIRSKPSGGGFYTDAAAGLSGGSIALISGLTPGQSYIFVAVAVNAAGQSAAGPPLNVLMTASGSGGGAALQPNTPAVPLAAKDCGSGSVMVTAPAWDTSELHPTQSMELRRTADNGATWSTIHTWSSAGGSYMDAAIADFTAYRYAVRGLNAAGASVWSASSSALMLQSSLTIEILSPDPETVLTGSVTLRFQLTDPNETADSCGHVTGGGPCAAEAPVFTVKLSGLTMAGTPTLEAAPSGEFHTPRNGVYALTINSRLFPSGMQELLVQTTGSDCCPARAIASVTIANDSQHGTFVKDFVLQQPPPAGLEWHKAQIGIENHALAENVEQQWWVQSYVATDGFAAWPFDGEDDAARIAETPQMQPLALSQGARWDGSGLRPATAQLSSPALFQQPGTSVLLRTVWTPVETMAWYQTGFQAVRKIRPYAANAFLIFAHDDDAGGAGVFSYNGEFSLTADLTSTAPNATDAARVADKIYVLRAGGELYVYDADSGDVQLSLGIPGETRPPLFIEAIGSRPLLLCVGSGSTTCYDLTFATPRLLWELDAEVTLTAVQGGKLLLAAGDTFLSSDGGTAPPAAVRSFEDAITALYPTAIGLESGAIWTKGVAGWSNPATLETAVNALGGFTGASPQPRFVAGGETDTLFGQNTTATAWIEERQLVPAAAMEAGSIESVTALHTWTRATEADPYAPDCLLIGTANSGLFGALQRSNLTAADGAFKASSIAYPSITPKHRTIVEAS